MKSNILVFISSYKRMTACSKQFYEEFYIRNDFFLVGFKTTLLTLNYSEAFVMYQRQYGRYNGKLCRELQEMKNLIYSKPLQFF